MRNLSGIACVVYLAAVLAACNGDRSTRDASPLDATQDAGDVAIEASQDGMSPDAGPPTVRFNVPASGLPAPFEVPFPSDVYRSDPDGTIVDGLGPWTAAGVGSVASFESYGALDGFGRQSGVLFRIDGADDIDPSSLPSDGASGQSSASSVVIVDIDTHAAMPGARVPCIGGYVTAVHMLTVVPDAFLLDEGHTYAAVVTTGVRTLSGLALAATPTFAAIRDDMPGARTSSLGALYGTAVDAVVLHAGIDRSRIAGLTVFTTQTSHHKLVAIHDALVAGTYGPAPQLNMDPAVAAPLTIVRFGAHAHPGWTATISEWIPPSTVGPDGHDLTGFPNSHESAHGVAHDALGVVLTGTFVSPEFRRPFMHSASRDDGTIAFDTSGHAIVQNAMQQIHVTITLPSAPAPSSGYPIVIFQHGAGQDRATVAALANQFAIAGIATAAIDLPFHGTRAADVADTLSRAGGTYAGPDGFADSSSPDAVLHVLGDAVNALAARDNVWQAALDLTQLRRMLAHIDLSSVADEYGGVAPRIDATRIGFTGDSAGGLVATIVAALEPRSSIDPFVPDVPPGAFFNVSLPDSPTTSAQLPAILLSAHVPTGIPIDRFNPFLNLVQGIFDGADASVFAQAAASAHNIWMLGATYDEAVSRASSDLMVRSFGATQLMPTIRSVPGVPQGTSPFRPATSGGVVTGYYEVAPGSHGHMLMRYEQPTTQPPWPRATSPRFPPVGATFTVRSPVVGTQRAVTDFFHSVWSGTPTIDVTSAAYLGLAPVADFDDDGYCDEQETGASPPTNPFDPSSHPASGSAACARDVGFPSL